MKGHKILCFSSYLVIIFTIYFFHMIDGCRISYGNELRFALWVELVSEEVVWLIKRLHEVMLQTFNNGVNSVCEKYWEVSYGSCKSIKKLNLWRLRKISFKSYARENSLTLLVNSETKQNGIGNQNRGALIIRVAFQNNVS